jgi:hypothetical protein
MKKSNAFLIAGLTALAVAIGWSAFRNDAPAPETASAPAPIAQPAAVPTSPAPLATPAPEAAPAIAMPAPPAAAGTDDTYNADEDDGTIAFKADPGGRIVTNEKARLDLERLYALYNTEEREKKMQEVAAALPPEAARQLDQLMAQYQNYQAAAYQAYPPGRELTTAEQGVSQVDGMHGLRVQYFGEQATQKMFGAEEKVQRELYKLMENEKDPSLTLEEKAERAQQIYQEQQPR